MRKPRNFPLFVIVTVFLAFAFANAHAQIFTESTLHNYCSLGGQECLDGSDPQSPLLLAADGDLYTSTVLRSRTGNGALVKIDPSGAASVFFIFCEFSCPDDASNPDGPMIQTADGTIYGTTNGVTYSNTGFAYHGTVFTITAPGKITVLHQFCNGESVCGNDGSGPKGLIEASDGNIYGTTYTGGAYNSSCGGTIFKLTPDGQVSTFYSFGAVASCGDGANPNGSLVQGTDGALYGTTAGGGAKGAGTVFRLALDGTLTTLHSFCSSSDGRCTDGAYPGTGLIQASDGNLYGNTIGYDAIPTVFRVTPAGELTTIYSFCPSGTPCTGGTYPTPLMQGQDGNLYGATAFGGTENGGTVYRLTLAGVLTTLYNFCSVGGDSCTDGYSPSDGLTEDAYGNFYGNASAGGTFGAGVAYKIAGPAQSTTVLAATPATASAGQKVDLTATVTGPAKEPTGSVTYSINNQSIGTAPLGFSSATLILDTADLAPGTYSVIATYAGSTVYYNSASTAVDVVINSAPTSVHLHASPNPATQSEPITLTATVTRSAVASSGVPSGSITFYLGTQTLGSGTLNASGVTSLTLPSGMAVGKYNMTAQYSGDTNDATSISNTVVETVQ